MLVGGMVYGCQESVSYIETPRMAVSGELNCQKTQKRPGQRAERDAIHLDVQEWGVGVEACIEGAVNHADTV